MHIYENLILLNMSGQSLKFFENTDWKPFGRMSAMAVRDYVVEKVRLVRQVCRGGCVVNNGLGDTVGVIPNLNLCPQCVKKVQPDVVYVDADVEIKYPSTIPEHDVKKLRSGGLFATSLFFPNAIPTRFLNDYKSEKCAVETRVICACDKGDTQQLKTFRKWAPSFFVQQFEEKLAKIKEPSELLQYYITNKTLPPITRDDIVSWIQSFPPHKRKRKYIALEAIDFGLFDTADPRLYEWSSIVKIQKEHELGIPSSSNPRLVQPCNEIINCLISIFGHRLQKIVEEVFSQKNSLKYDFVFAAGCNSTDVEKIYNRLAQLLSVGGVIGEGDFSSYDRSQNPTMHAVMIDIYQYFGMPPDLLHFRRKQVYAVTRTNHGMYIKQNGTLRSGAFDTCFFNSIINYLTHVYGISRSCDLSPSLVVKKLLIILMGDDNLFHYPIPPLSLDKALRDLGLTTKMKFHKDVSKITFLNTFPILVDDKWCVSLKPGRILSRLTVSTESQRHLSHYLARIAQGMNECGKNTPILRVLFPELFRMSQIENIQPLYDRYNRRLLTADVEHEFCANTTQLDIEFCARYDITVEQLHNLEREFQEYLRDNILLIEILKKKRRLQTLQTKGGFVHAILDKIFITDGVYSGAAYEC
jgi:hypothetical protein